MQYMLIFYEDSNAFAERTDPAKADTYWGAWNAYVGAMGQAGIVRNGDGLQPPETATTVRMVEGERMVQDGPATASREQLGGYFIIDVPGLDEALAWAARSPSAGYGSVEVRPVLPPPAR